MHLGIVRLILDNEDNKVRFERLARLVASHVLGRPIVATSQTADLGRDGICEADGHRRTIVAASTASNVQAKLKADLASFIAAPVTDADWVFVTSRSMTELKKHELLEEAAPLLAPFQCVPKIISRDMYADFLTENADFAKLYATEIDQLAIDLANDVEEDPSSLATLRLALNAVVGDDAPALRLELLRSAILTCLAQQNAQRVAGIRTLVSALMRLSHPLDLANVEQAAESLRQDGLIERAADKYTLTASGRESVAAAADVVAARRTELASRVRAAIEKALGHGLGDSQWNELWVQLEVRMSELFHAYGATTVASISALISSNSDASVAFARLDVVGEIANGAARSVTPTALQERVRTAIRDAFLDETSPARDWLETLAASYVMVASLGLDRAAAGEIRRALGSMSLALDSDVVLSILAEGEPRSEATRALVQSWIRVGGKAFVPDTVLREVAYHASFALRDFDAIMAVLPSVGADRAIFLAGNAFVKGYLSVAQRIDRNEFVKYVSAFRGQGKFDYGPIVSSLGAYGIRRLPVKDLRSGAATEPLLLRLDQLGTRLANEEAERGHFSVDHRIRDKCERDSETLVAVARENESAQADGRADRMLIVSSASRLRRLASRFDAELSGTAVVPLSVVPTLLSLVPDAKLSPATLRHLLFLPDTQHAAGGAEQLIQRVIYSLAPSFPTAGRAALRSELRKYLAEAARNSTSRTVADIQKEIVQNPEVASKVVLELSRRLALGDEPAKEFARLKEMEVEISRTVGKLSTPDGDD